MEHGRPRRVEIEQLFDYLKSVDDESLYSYFKSTINLVSLMCQQRNYRGIEVCVDMYKLEFVIECFLNEKIEFPLRSNFAKTLVAVHIDKDPLKVVNLPNFTRVWDDIAKQKTEITKSKEFIPKELHKLQ